MKKSRLKIIAYVVIIEILFIGIVDPLLSIFISTNLNSRIVSGTLLFTMLIVAGELYSLLFRTDAIISTASSMSASVWLAM